MFVMSIDPGTTHSGYAVLDEETTVVQQFGNTDNHTLGNLIERQCTEYQTTVVIEQIKSYGMAIGQTTLDTCVWIGRFIERANSDVVLIPRKTIVTELTGSPKANDSNIRRYVLDYYTELHEKLGYGLGGGAEPVIGRENNPGILHGATSHVFQAIAVGLCYIRQNQGRATHNG